MPVLPIRLRPDPLVSSTVELRFEPLLDRKAVVGAVYYKLREQFPVLETLTTEALPEALRPSGPDFCYRPQVRASNDQFRVYLAEQSITVGVVGTYPGWQAFSDTIQDVLRQVHGLGVVGEVQRLGLRYVSFFEGNALPGFKLTLNLPGHDGQQLPSSVLMRLPAVGCEHLLQLANFIDRSQASGLPAEAGIVGTVVDIDTEPTQPPTDFFTQPAHWLDLLHLAEKELFYGLLTDEFLHTLHPEYQ